MAFTTCSSCSETFSGKEIAKKNLSSPTRLKRELLGSICHWCEAFLCTSCKSKGVQDIIHEENGQNTCSSCGQASKLPFVLVEESVGKNNEGETGVVEPVALESSGLDLGVRILITIAIALLVLVFYFDAPISVLLEGGKPMQRWSFGPSGGIK